MTPVLALLLAAQTAPAGGQDWWYVTASGGLGSQNAHYADRTSIRRTGDRVRIDEAREGESADEQGIIAARLGMEYDCRARTGRIVTYVFLGDGGRVLMQGTANETPRGVDRDSVYDQMMNFACGQAQGLEQLGRLRLREQALLLFTDRAAYLRAHPEEAH